eukprot:4161001-Pyramimonas_sp.AAC.1
MIWASSGCPGTPLGPVLGSLRGHLGASRAVGRLTWAAWERLGTSFRILGAPGGRLGPSWSA